MGDTDFVPVAGTVCRFSQTVVAPTAFHCRVADPPGWIEVGLAVKVISGGAVSAGVVGVVGVFGIVGVVGVVGAVAESMICVVAVALPAWLVAVRV